MGRRRPHRPGSLKLSFVTSRFCPLSRGERSSFRPWPWSFVSKLLGYTARVSGQK